MRNAGQNDHWSLSSDQYPASGRSSKASIGIVAEKYPKVGSAGRKDNAAALPSCGILSSCQDLAVEENKGKAAEENLLTEVVETIQIRQEEPDNQNVSAWLSSRSVHHEGPTEEAVQFYGNQAPVVQSEDDLHNKLDTLADEKRMQKGHAMKRNRVPCTVESLEVKQLEVRDTKSSAHFSSRSVHHKTPTTESVEIYKNHTKDPLSSGSDLKFKLHENVFSFDEEKAESLGRTQSGHSTKSKANKSDQNITRIEPQSIYSRIPVVRQKGLQSREREQTLSSPEKENSKGEYGSSSPSWRSKNRFMRQKDMKKNRIGQTRNCLPRELIPEKVLRTNEKEQELLSPDISSLQSLETGGSTTPRKDKKGFMQTPTLQKTTKIEPHNTYSTKKVAAEKKMQSDEREHVIPSSPDRASVRSEETYDNHHTQFYANRNLGNQPRTYNSGTDRMINAPSSIKEKYSWENVMSPPVSKAKETYLHKTVLSPSLQRKTAVADDFASPTFAMDVTPPSPPSEKLLNEVFGSHVRAQLINLSRKSNCTKPFVKSKPASCGSDVNSESSDGGEKVTGANGRALHQGKYTKPQKKSSPSPIEDLDTESPETDDSKIRGNEFVSDLIRPGNFYSIRHDVILSLYRSPSRAASNS